MITNDGINNEIHSANNRRINWRDNVEYYCQGSHDKIIGQSIPHH